VTVPHPDPTPFLTPSIRTNQPNPNARATCPRRRRISEQHQATGAEELVREAGFRRPVVVVQGDSFNQSRIATVVCVALTGNLRWAEAPGNVLLPARATRLSKDSVANVSQLVTPDRSVLGEHVSKLSRRRVEMILSGMDALLGQ